MWAHGVGDLLARGLLTAGVASHATAKTTFRSLRRERAIRVRQLCPPGLIPSVSGNALDA